MRAKNPSPPSQGHWWRTRWNSGPPGRRRGLLRAYQMDSCGTNSWTPWGLEGCLLCPLDCIVLDRLTVRPLFCWCTGLEHLCSVQRYVRGVTLSIQVAEEMLWAKLSFHLAHHELLPSSLSDSQRWEGQPYPAQEAPPGPAPTPRRVLSGGLATLGKVGKEADQALGSQNPQRTRKGPLLLARVLPQLPAQLQVPGAPPLAPCWWSKHKLHSNLLFSSK